MYEIYKTNDYSTHNESLYRNESHVERHHHNEHRFAVADFDIHHVALPVLISAWILLAIFAKIGTLNPALNINYIEIYGI